MPKGFTGNPNGRPKGTPNKRTVFQKQLADLLPDARAALAAAVKMGDMKAVDLLFKLTFAPPKSAYPAIPLDLDQSPRAILEGAKRLLANGDISTGHYLEIIDAMLKTTKLETSISLAARVIDTEPLDMAKALTVTAAQCGDLETAQDSLAKVLQYSVPRPQPEPPEPQGTVSAEPHPDYGLSEEEKLEKWQAELDQYKDG